jgi:hypothetical protein
MITSTTSRRSRRMLLCGAIALSGLGLTGVTLSGVANAAPASHAATVRTAPADGTDDSTTDDTSSVDDSEYGDDGGWGNDDSTDWAAEANTEQDQLAAYLDDHGIAYTVETEDEWRWVVVDDTDQAANDAIDDFYWSLYPATQEEIDSYNADTDSLVAFFQDAGIDITVTTDRHGYRDAEWNWDDPAAEAAYEDYEWQQYPTSAEDIAAMNAETEAEVAYLTDQGLDASMDAGSTDEDSSACG